VVDAQNKICHRVRLFRSRRCQARGMLVRGKFDPAFDARSSATPARSKRSLIPGSSKRLEYCCLLITKEPGIEAIRSWGGVRYCFRVMVDT
jgi:hypothetical protein